jgi:hypothetical protein
LGLKVPIYSRGYWEEREDKRQEGEKVKRKKEKDGEWGRIEKREDEE